MDWLNYHHLRYFWAVAREGSVSLAAKQLRVAQPTVSEQLRGLEDALGEKLFERAGRGIALTEVGKVTYRFADEIFALGRELTDTVKGRTSGRPRRLTVGVLDAVPKMVAVRLLEPALALGSDLRLIGYEGKAERLLDQLAAHELDVVLADAPMGPSHDRRAYNHLLGEARVGLFGTEALVKSAKRNFPFSLAEMPFLLPTPDAPLRRALDGWLDAKGIVPRVVAELQDSALLTTLGELGHGLFAAPEVIFGPSARARGLRRAGWLDPLRERFYAITVARRIEHPAVAAIAGAARRDLFPTRGRSGTVDR
jgi:LysR family transcriptional activator of nhaA